MKSEELPFLGRCVFTLLNAPERSLAPRHRRLRRAEFNSYSKDENVGKVYGVELDNLISSRCRVDVAGKYYLTVNRNGIFGAVR